ncbi:MAG: hypothetical protein HZB40_16065 [Rhodocyclales bacterium]|nr:hypothetical protein [Rhodocyclales bacterium]
MKLGTLHVKLLGTALLTIGFAAPAAQAQSWGSEIRQDYREIRQDRRELRNDYRELAEDRADYARARAAGDVNAMRRERMEIRQDMAEIRRDKAELRHDLRERRQDFRGHQAGGGDYRRSGWGHDRHDSWAGSGHDRHASWNRAGQERHAARQDWRQQHRGNPLQPAAWQGNRPPQAATPATSGQGNNGRHTGWTRGRGNPHGG